MHIRRAHPSDTDTIVRLIRELAEYERELDAVEASEFTLHDTLFGGDPRAFCDLVEVESEDVGIAIWLLNYSTWQAKYGIDLEDLYVRPVARGRGYGLALLQHRAQLCVVNAYGRFQWSVLDWNQSTIDFYVSLGAVPLDEWTTYRVTGPALTKLAQLHN